MTVGFPSKRASDAETVLMTSSCEQSEPPLIDVNRFFCFPPNGAVIAGSTIRVSDIQVKSLPVI